MARIVSSKNAPSEKVHYSLGQVEFDLGGNKAKAYDTKDREAIANAVSHPWLDVEFDKSETVEVQQRQTLVDPKKDVLSVTGPRGNDAFDVSKIKAAEAAKVEGAVPPVAIEAGADQSKAVEAGGVAETITAEEDERK